MGNFFEDMANDNQKNLEAIEKKGKEYEQVAAEIAELKATVAGLKADIDGLKGSITGLNSTLKTISPQDIDKFKKESLTIFEPLQKTAEAVNTKIKSAGYEATQTLRMAGKRTFIDYLYEAVVIAILFVVLDSFVLWQFFGLSDMRKTVNYISNETDVIHYNQTTGQTAGTFDPWHMPEFWKAYNQAAEQARQQKIMEAQQK